MNANAAWKEMLERERALRAQRRERRAQRHAEFIELLRLARDVLKLAGSDPAEKDKA